MNEAPAAGVDPRLRKVFADVLSAEIAQALTPEASSETLPQWDSQSFVAIVVAVEQEFGVRFASLEAARMSSVAEIQRLLRDKGVELRT